MDLINRLLAAINAHDLEAAAAMFHEGYRSEQPAHPGRAFTGRDQMHANWAAMFAGIPDFHAELRGFVQDDDTVWSEWVWSGRRTDGLPFETRGVTLFQVEGEFIVAGRLHGGGRDGPDRHRSSGRGDFRAAATGRVWP